MIFVYLIFISFTSLCAEEVSPFIRGKSDRELLDYADAVGNTVKFKLSEEICNFSPAERDYALIVIGKNELNLIYYSDILMEHNKYTSEERSELYELIDKFESQSHRLREYLLKIHQ